MFHNYCSKLSSVDSESSVNDINRVAAAENRLRTDNQCVRACTRASERQTIMTSLFPQEIMFPKLWLFHYVADLMSSSRPSLSFSVSVCPTLDTAAMN